IVLISGFLTSDVSHASGLLRLASSKLSTCHAAGSRYTAFPKMFAPSIPRCVRPKGQRASFLNSQLSTLNTLRRRAAFTLVELLIVVGIIGLLLVLIAPAFTTIKGGTDVTSAAYTVKSVLDTARTYAKANDTYSWVGFYEEDVSQPSTNPPTAGTGRLVMS